MKASIMSSGMLSLSFAVFHVLNTSTMLVSGLTLQAKTSADNCTDRMMLINVMLFGSKSVEAVQQYDYVDIIALEKFHYWENL